MAVDHGRTSQNLEESGGEIAYFLDILAEYPIIPIYKGSKSFLARPFQMGKSAFGRVSKV
jgi:hypothetical protein